MSILSLRKKFNYTLERLNIVKKMRTTKNTTELINLMLQRADSEIEQLTEEIKDSLKNREKMQKEEEDLEKQSKFIQIFLDDIEKSKKGESTSIDKYFENNN